jgi:hypothetical protein
MPCGLGASCRLIAFAVLGVAVEVGAGSVASLELTFSSAARKIADGMRAAAEVAIASLAAKVASRFIRARVVTDSAFTRHVALGVSSAIQIAVMCAAGVRAIA